MALDFGGGAGDDVDIGNPSVLQLTGACTLMCWVNFDVNLQNIDIISKQTSGARGFSLQTDDDPPDDMWGIFYIAETVSLTKSSGWTATPLVPGVWYHLAGQFVPSTAVQIWLNGVLSGEKTTAIPATMYDPSNNVTFGGRPDDLANLNGKKDDVKIFDRNLSAAEMMMAYRGIHIGEGLLGHWGFDEKSSGTTASGAGSIIDRHNNANHGTPNGTVQYAEWAPFARV